MSKLLDAVKAKCKAMGLSEKFLKDLTEALGGGLTENSTEEEFNSVVEQIVTVAGHSQGEVTRKLQDQKSKNPTKPKKGDDDDDQGDDDDDKPDSKKNKGDEPKDDWKKAIAELRKEWEEQRKADEEKRDAESKRKARQQSIADALEKYKIPEKKRRFVQNVPDDVEDVDKYIGEFAQEIVTDGLPDGDGGQKKVPTQKETEEIGKGLFSRFNWKKDGDNK